MTVVKQNITNKIKWIKKISVTCNKTNNPLTRNSILITTMMIRQHVESPPILESLKTTLLNNTVSDAPFDYPLFIFSKSTDAHEY